jgi:peptide/nickel transport system ATP-binding protein
MQKSFLSVKDLSIYYENNCDSINAVENFSFHANKGEIVGIIGETGSGKSSIALALMGLLEGKGEKVSGNIYYNGVDIWNLIEKKKYRWEKAAIVFQNRLEILNPFLKLREQLFETIKHVPDHEKYIENIISTLKKLDLDTIWLDRYPHELSGGMRQKFLLSMALACQPQILIMDEPTSALDTISKIKVVRLLKELNEKQAMTIILITHDIMLAKQICNRVIVLYKGNLVEAGSAIKVFNDPAHPYTKGLLNSSPDFNPYGDLWGIPEKIHSDAGNGCRFFCRCFQAVTECKTKLPKPILSCGRQIACLRGGIVTRLHAKNINKTYLLKGKKIKACDSCDIKVRAGEIVTLVGPPGAGKSTLAGIISGFIKQDKGKIFYNDKEVKDTTALKMIDGIQIVFQDPYSAIDEYMTVAQSVQEPLRILKIYDPQKQLKHMKSVLETVGLTSSTDFIAQKCGTLSGGQRQRVALARSLIMEPQLLIADEITSMLDASTKANILRVLKEQQNKKGFSMLYITHDISIARKIADTAYVMQNGKIVDWGNAQHVLKNYRNDVADTN